MSSIEVSADSSTAELVAELAETADALARLPAPDVAQAAMDEADQLWSVVDRVGVAIDRRVGVVDAAGAAKAAGYASTCAWLRSSCDPAHGGRMAARDASRRRLNGRQFRRLPATVAAVDEGRLSYGMASAIAAAVSVLSDDEDVAAAEQILLTLAGDPTATVEKVRRAGRYLRQVLDPDGHLRDHEKTHRSRYLSAHLDDDGGMDGSFYLPPEAAARLQALFDTYARPSSQTDTRTQSQRQADVLIQLLAQAVAAELLIVVNAETLPDDLDAYAQTDDVACDRRQCARTTHAGHADGNTNSDSDRNRTGDRDGGGVWRTDGGQPNHRAEPGDPPTGAPPEDGIQHPPDAIIPSWPAPGLDPDLAEQLCWIRSSRSRMADGISPSTDRCQSGGRASNRDVPGLLLPTGHPLPAPDVRRLARTSSLYRMVLEAPSKVLDLGSAVRAVPGWMRRAILATYDTCAYDACPIPAKWCEMDHVRPWSTHHRTRLEDLTPGCDHHNRDRATNPHKYHIGRTHDGRWHITSTRRYRV